MNWTHHWFLVYIDHLQLHIIRSLSFSLSEQNNIAWEPKYHHLRLRNHHKCMCIRLYYDFQLQVLCEVSVFMKGNVHDLDSTSARVESVRIIDGCAFPKPVFIFSSISSKGGAGVNCWLRALSTAFCDVPITIPNSPPCKRRLPGLRMTCLSLTTAVKDLNHQ